MKTSELVEVRKHREEMLDSYIKAIREVGGAPDMFLQDIDKMTVAEMMDVLAQNRVRFCVKPKKEPTVRINMKIDDESDEIFRTT